MNVLARSQFKVDRRGRLARPRTTLSPIHVRVLLETPIVPLLLLSSESLATTDC